MDNILKILSDLGVEVTDEQKTAIDEKVKVNYKTIAEVEKINAKLTKSTEDNKALNEKLESISTEFDGKSAEQWKGELDKLIQKQKDDETARQQAEKDAKADADLKARFDGLYGKSKWLNEHTKNGVYQSFKEKLNDDAYKGKGDKDIFEELTKDQNFFENPQGKPNLPNYSNTEKTNNTSAPPVPTKSWNKWA